MPVTLKQVVDHVVAMEETPPDRLKLEKQLREAFHVVGLAVNPQNDEVYDQAAGARSPMPQQRNVRFAGMRRAR